MRRSATISAMLVCIVALVSVAASADPVASSSRRAEPCAGGCGWQPGMSLPDISGPVWAMAVFDDGSGPALYVGGEFATAGNVIVNNIAKWNGSAWSPLPGPTAVGVGGREYTATGGAVEALAVFNGALYVGGQFINAGGAKVNHIAKWTGASWSTLSDAGTIGTDGDVESFAVWNDGSGAALYAGGGFSNAGTITANHVAKWNGTAWSALTGPSGTGVNYSGSHSVLALQPTAAGLYVAGYFDTAGGLAANNIALWNGSVWSSLTSAGGNGIQYGKVYALAEWNDGNGNALYAAGNYMLAGGQSVSDIAKWNGSDWTAVGGGVGSTVSGYITIYALHVWDDGSGAALYAGGWFTTAGGSPTNYIARWNGSAWSAINAPLNGVGYTVRSMGDFDDGRGSALYAGGYFSTAGGTPASRIAKLKGGAWSVLAPNTGLGTYDAVYALAKGDVGGAGSIYAGGPFVAAAGQALNSIGRLDSVGWHPMSGPSGTGVNNTVNAITIWNDGAGDAVYAGGWFTTAGGVTVNRIAKWDGAQWSALRGGVFGAAGNAVYALTTYNDGNGSALYAGGDIWKIDDVVCNGIGRWNGSQWTALTGPSGTGISGGWNKVYALAVWDDGTGSALYVGGDFTLAGGVTVNNIARWNGSEWQALTGSMGTGTSAAVYSLAVHDDGSGPALYAAGSFYNVGTTMVRYIARWNGHEWSELDYGLEMSPVRTLLSWNDGTGSALYAGGDFASRLSRWRGGSWSSLAAGTSPATNGPVFALLARDKGNEHNLYVGGSITTAGTTASTGLALWRCVGVSGDANGDGALTVADIFYLINHLFAGGPTPVVSSDVNADGTLTAADIIYLLSHLFAGGPAPR